MYVSFQCGRAYMHTFSCGRAYMHSALVLCWSCGSFSLHSHICCAMSQQSFPAVPHHVADDEQELWIPAVFAIPWLLGQQVRQKRQQMHQTKENGHQIKSKKSKWSVGAGQEGRDFRVGRFNMHTTTIPDMAARSSAVVYWYWIGNFVLLAIQADLQHRVSSKNEGSKWCLLMHQK